LKKHAYLILHACLILIVFALTGCATAPQTQMHDGLSPGKGGYVYVNYPKSNPGTPISVRSVLDGKTYELDSILNEKVNGAGAWLPAGNYTIATWDSYPFGNYTQFQVEAGHVTDLGSLIPVTVGGYEFVVLPLRPAELSGVIGSIIQRYREFLTSTVPIEWDPVKPPPPIQIPQPGSPLQLGALVAALNAYDQHLNKPPLRQQLLNATSIESFFELAKASSQPDMRIPVTDGRGGYYFGADFGQIRTRDSHGIWNTIDTGTLHAVTALTRYGSMLVAGYDNGQIRISNDEGKSWKPIGLLDCGGTILSISRTGSRWLAIAVQQTLASNGLEYADQVIVYMSDDGTLENLARINSASLKLKSAVWVAYLRAQSLEDNYFINAAPDLMKLDLGTMTWAPVSLPGEISNYSINRPKGTISAFFAKGAFSKLYVSTDEARSWMKYKAPPYAIADVVFKSAGEGMGVRVESKFFTTAIQFMRYSSPTGEWQLLSEAPETCARVFDDADETPRFCITKGGTIFGFSDGKWAIEYSSE